MHALDLILNFFRDGGIFLYPIALVWVIGLVIALERFGFVMKVGAGNRRVWSQVQPLLEGGKFREALQAVSSSETALAHIMRYGITRIQTARRRDDITPAPSMMTACPTKSQRTPKKIANGKRIMVDESTRKMRTVTRIAPTDTGKRRNAVSQPMRQLLSRRRTRSSVT